MNELSTRYLGLTLDPLHVGAGGYRLGRVDNTIIREPGTNLPKIPGSSIAGVCRNYSIYGLNNGQQEEAMQCASHDDPKAKNNCGQCQICQTYGFASGTSKKNQIGRVKFFDAFIVAFPVSTMVGPVWITTFSILQKMGLDLPEASVPADEEVVIGFDLPGQEQGQYRINLGWLYLDARKIDSFAQIPGNHALLNYVNAKLTVVPEWLFSELVNNNLEVRTSVSIDFQTGAADPGKLFTYEAIPRGSVLTFDVVVDTFRCTELMPSTEVAKIVNSGLDLFATLGLGGMNTRGFGRMEVVPY